MGYCVAIIGISVRTVRPEKVNNLSYDTDFGDVEYVRRRMLHMKSPGRGWRRPKRKVMEPVKDNIKENVVTVEAVYHWEKRERISPLAACQGKSRQTENFIDIEDTWTWTKKMSLMFRNPLFIITLTAHEVKRCNWIQACWVQTLINALSDFIKEWKQWQSLIWRWKTNLNINTHFCRIDHRKKIINYVIDNDIRFTSSSGINLITFKMLCVSASVKDRQCSHI